MEKRVIFYTTLFLVLISSSSQYDATTKEQIETTLSSTQTVVEIVAERNKELKEAGKAIGTIASAVGSLAPFLGAAGAFLSIILAFLPKEDSAELKFMKKGFAEVNKKLDIITNKLDGIERSIEFEAQKQAYIDAENKINFGYNQLTKFYDEVMKVECKKQEECARERLKIAERYIKDFKPVERALFMILKNSYQKNTFAKPLVELIKSKFQCNVEKLNAFAETIYLLARKGQQVVVTYHKLTGSKTSIVTAVQEWLDMVYSLRAKVYKEKNKCYKQISTYMASDIADPEYQNGKHVDAFKRLNRIIKNKYAWIGWNFQIYNAIEEDEQAFKVFEGFSNAPATKEKRKRVIIATPVDKRGTYSKDIINLVRYAIKKITINANDFFVVVRAAIEEYLSKAGALKMVQSIVVLDPDVSIDIEVDRFSSYINEVFAFKSSVMDFPHIKRRVVVMLKSSEADNTFCKENSCHGKSKCVQLPYTKLTECQCERLFDGTRCETYSDTSMKSTLDLLLTTSLQIPSLTDVYFDIKDLRKSFENGIENVNKAIARLGNVLEKSYTKLSQQLGNEFRWTNLKVTYSLTISNVEHFIIEFTQKIKNNKDERVKKLAEHILEPGKIKKWLRDLNLLFVGNKNIIQDHEPLPVVIMNRNLDACTTPYKKRVDHVYAQFSILQQQAYMMWAQALFILEKDTTEVIQLYAQTVTEQINKLKEITCDFVIQDSINVQCTGGYYAHPSLKITNQCRQNYYVSGPKTATCSDKTKSKCYSCSCNKEGSNHQGCSDQDGVCSCKTITVNKQQRTYYGNKCQNFNCVWSDWTSWSERLKNCDPRHGEMLSRTRTPAKDKMGTGEPCPGNSKESQSAYTGCGPLGMI
ncbi:SE-cephalotoxin-like isoform X2 [Clytia hemisphaerica]|uniref:EGF-like domain-containing protein n=1 Tax=Clytia hemisphaerica TaxID=252671 RepID=A0A7M5XFH0_9CNID